MFSDIKTRPMEVLLLEDGLMDARVTIHALRRSGIHHRLTLVRRVDEAILFLQRKGIFARAPRPDLLLLDMNLPDGTGFDILEWLEENETRITTVVLTATHDEATRARCEDMKVHDFITKPVNQDKFLRVVRDHKRLMIHSTPVLSPV
ncbi:response regulator [Planctomycetes bacterium K23_9]|uniref:Response regulator rcp1 n=1 Tax=Stieleria marina TaxID=1930275 RepID=A0A517NVE3_9BACT|nr:Response regulator rcp1 [Planctomycetes bacterium K23_9]